MFNQDPKNSNEKRIERDFRTATHDLNNLLNNILSGIELLKDKADKINSTDQLLKFIEKNSLLASDIIQQFSLSNSTYQKEKTIIDLKSIVLDTIELLGNDFCNTIHLEGIQGDHNIWGNYIDLKRVLINLIINAYESCRDRPVIKIKLSTISPAQDKGKKVCKICITDNGSGITEENLNQLFEVGFSTKPNSSSRGIGLSIVKTIIDEHNGTIEVTSNAKQGTSFELKFPYFKFQESAKRIENKKVIIAEDDEFQREVLKDLLKSLKLNVFTASNGVEALELYTSMNPDILFIDNNMPGMTGLECSKSIKEMDESTNIVLVTGSNFNKSDLTVNVTKVLKKPYSFEAIENTIHELL